MEESWSKVAELLLSRETNLWLITTILLITYIGVSKARSIICKLVNKEACINNNETVRCEKMTQKDFVYLAAIMTIVSVFLISLALYTDKDAMSLFSFASTLTSIILSVIAIILSITSENRNTLTKDLLNKSADKVEKATDALGEYVNKIDGYKLEDVNESIARLEGLLSNAISKIESLDSKMDHYINVGNEETAEAKVIYPTDIKGLSVIKETDYREKEGTDEFTNKN